MQVFKPAIRWWSLVNPRIIAHFSESLEVHSDRLLYRKGLLSKSEVVIPFSRVANYEVDQNFFDRMVGIGNFRIETAGSSIAPELMLTGYSYELMNIFTQSIKADNA